MAFTRRSRAEHGQATVELVALLPLMAVLAALLWQAVVAGQAVWLAGSAARAAARASAIGSDASAAARRVLPDRLERGLVVRPATGGGDGVQVAIAIPAIVGSGRLTTVSARARLQDQAR
ncbi:MAG: pilus assembly protein [Actinobacteria bacterium]|nr:pilus assembly protein [Actinomycetota bacterium]